MDVSRFLSKVLGIYLLIVSTMMLINMPQFLLNIYALIDQPSLMFVTGFVTLILGILMVVSHNIWQFNWRVIITILSWLILIKGISILFDPLAIDKLSIILIHSIYAAYLSAGMDFMLGILLCYFGFRRGELSS